VSTQHKICDGHGNELCDGLEDGDVYRVARRLANECREPVYIYAPEDTDETAERIDPEGP
jgi:hypothetical protein